MLKCTPQRTVDFEIVTDIAHAKSHLTEQLRKSSYFVSIPTNLLFFYKAGGYSLKENYWPGYCSVLRTSKAFGLFICQALNGPASPFCDCIDRHAACHFRFYITQYQNTLSRQTSFPCSGSLSTRSFLYEVNVTFRKESRNETRNVFRVAPFVSKKQSQILR